MDLDRSTGAKLRKYTQVFREARERQASEADTVLLLSKFLEDVLGFDALAGEVSREHQIQGRYCDIAVKISGEVVYLLEAKQAGLKLSEREIEQAENYASRSGIEWVVLTNGVEWQLYHLTFVEGEGISHELAFSVDLIAGIEGDSSDPKRLWSCLSLLSREVIEDGGLEEFWHSKTALSAGAVIKALFTQPVLTVLRRELNRGSEVRLAMEDVFDGVRDILSKDALLVAGHVKMPRKRRRRRGKATGETEVAVPSPIAQLDAMAPAVLPAPPAGPEVIAVVVAAPAPIQ